MIDVNKVYKAVLSIMNREQRGLLTPEQFNRIAKQVQLDLMENTFYEYNRALYKKKVGAVSMDYGNIPKIIKERLDYLSSSLTIPVLSILGSTPKFSTLDLNGHNIYRVVNISSALTLSNIDEISKTELRLILRSPLTYPDKSNPVYVREVNLIKIYSGDFITEDVIVDFIKMPLDPFWAFSVDQQYGTYEYEPSTSIHFALHPSEEVSLITNILAYAGVTIKDAMIAQAAAAELTSKQNQENS